MSNQKAVFATVKALVGQSNILTIPRVFVDFTGSLDKALFLSQALYWSDKGKDGWFYKSYREWQEETTLSEYQIRKAAKCLQAKGLLETKVKKADGTPVLHYRLIKEKLVSSIMKFLQGPPLKNSRNYPYKTKTTTETTEGVFKDNQVTGSLDTLPYYVDPVTRAIWDQS